MQFLQEAQYLASRLERGESTREAFAERFSATVARALGLVRTGVWWTECAGEVPALACLGSHDADPAYRTPGLADARIWQTGFIDALERDGAICAADAAGDPATAELHRQVLARHGVASLMAVPCSINGELHGAFLCFSIGSRTRWSAHQLATLRRLVARVGPALAGTAGQPVVFPSRRAYESVAIRA